jgi:hypothetical protein
MMRRGAWAQTDVHKASSYFCGKCFKRARRPTRVLRAHVQHIAARTLWTRPHDAENDYTLPDGLAAQQAIRDRRRLRS